MSTLRFIYLSVLFSGLLGCSANKTTTHSITPTDDCKNNNHIVVKSKNTKDKGSNDKVIFKGKNNLVEFDYDSSEYAAKNHNNVVIVEGNQNNTKIVQKNVKDYSKDSRDTLVIKGDKQKNTITTSNETDQDIGSSGTTAINKAQEDVNPGNDFKDFSDDDEEIYIENLDSTLKVKDAFMYYMNKAKHGDVDAYYQVGVFYQNGTGIKPNGLKAIQYYELAARKNNVLAQYMLGDIYQNGLLGIAPDLQKAKYYFSLASKNGNWDAAQRLKDLDN